MPDHSTLPAASELLDQVLDVDPVQAEECLGLEEGCSCRRCCAADRVNRLGIATMRRQLARTQRPKRG